MDDSLLENLGISSRLRWYHDHINVNGNLSKTWQCFLHDVNGTIPITNDLQLHKLSFGPLISEGSHTSILPKEQLSCLYSIKPGPIPGVLILYCLYFYHSYL